MWVGAIHGAWYLKEGISATTDGDRLELDYRNVAGFPPSSLLQPLLRGCSRTSVVSALHPHSYYPGILFASCFFFFLGSKRLVNKRKLICYPSWEDTHFYKHTHTHTTHIPTTCSETTTNSYVNLHTPTELYTCTPLPTFTHLDTHRHTHFHMHGNHLAHEALGSRASGPHLPVCSELHGFHLVDLCVCVPF